jgi:histidinol-phosphate aminotransferase
VKLSIHKDIQDIPFYPKAAMYGTEPGWIRMASNEIPFPPSPQVFSSILDSLFSVNRYPGGEFELKKAIAEKLRLEPENVLIGDGSDELIEMALKGMRHDTKKGVVISEPSFAFYSIAARTAGYTVHKVPTVHLRVNLKTVLQAIDGGTRVVFLNNPLNPTGTIFEDEDFSRFLGDIPPDVLIVVDEAYGEFVESKKFPDSPKYMTEFPVLTLRTFSKAYGLAGLRVGYGLGDASLISFLERTKQPFSVNLLGLIGAKAALLDDGYLKKVLANNRKGKRFLYKALKDLSLTYVPTEANYIMVKIGPQAETLCKNLFEEKILVRWMGAYGLPDYLRITIGTMDENIQLVEALRTRSGVNR